MVRRLLMMKCVNWQFNNSGPAEHIQAPAAILKGVLMYRETLMNQWANLYSDFDHDFELLQNQGKAPDCFNRWYATRLHRWSSITYSEGILLEQENNPEFAHHLKNTMGNFRFQFVTPAKKIPVWPGIAVGAAVGAAASAILMLVHWGAIKSVIGGIVLCMVIASGSFRSNAAFRKKEKNREKNEYVGQLKDYKKKLIAVCDKYRIN